MGLHDSGSETSQAGKPNCSHQVREKLASQIRFLPAANLVSLFHPHLVLPHLPLQDADDRRRSLRHGQGILWAVGEIWHDDGCVGRRKPGWVLPLRASQRGRGSRGRWMMWFRHYVSHGLFSCQRKKFSSGMSWKRKRVMMSETLLVWSLTLTDELSNPSGVLPEALKVHRRQETSLVLMLMWIFEQNSKVLLLPSGVDDPDKFDSHLAVSWCHISILKLTIR